MIKAPYNFVPVEGGVFIPDWEKSISHDVPFSDGESGEIRLRITAKSPIYVRNGVSKDEQDEKSATWKSFSKHGNHFFIPGTSIKGAIRNVLEIISFGKMFCPPSDSSSPGRRVMDTKHSFRDLSPAAKKDYLDQMKPNSIHCGWLYVDRNGKHVVEDCGKPLRISHQDIDSYLGTSFKRTFSSTNKNANWNDNDFKTAKYKYGRVTDKSRLTTTFETQTLENMVRAEPKTGGEVDGTIVFTGQPGPRNEGKKAGKKWEFVFKRLSGGGELIELPEKLWRDFLAIYNDGDESRISKDWKYWREKERIPVFFRLRENTREIEHLGLAFLYKMPTKSSVSDGLDSRHRSETSCDLADCIFGFVADDRRMREKNEHQRTTLKGRVHFSHAWALKSHQLDEKTVVLGSPKSSYYPNYLEQPGNNGRTNNYSTYMNGKPKIRGWKRYPVHRGNNVTRHCPDETTNMQTKFIPLAAGAKFEFSIRAHNLRKMELGALLSALTFHDNEGCFHSLGMAKPLGYGKCGIEIIDSKGFHVDLTKPDERRQYLEAFETELCLNLFNSKPEWHISPQVKELLTTASEHPEFNADEHLSYMTLKEHVDAKNRDQMAFLRRFSELPGVCMKEVGSYVNDEKLNNIILKRAQREKAERAEKEAMERRKQEEREKAERERKEAEQRQREEAERKQAELEHRQKEERGLSHLDGCHDLGKILADAKKIEMNDSRREKLYALLLAAAKKSSAKDKKRYWGSKGKGKDNWKQIRQLLGDTKAQELEEEVNT